MTAPTPEHQRLEADRIGDKDWVHLNNDDIFSMPDTWEYPCYAARDLAFHSIPFAWTPLIANIMIIYRLN